MRVEVSGVAESSGLATHAGHACDPAEHQAISAPTKAIRRKPRVILSVLGTGNEPDHRHEEQHGTLVSLAAIPVRVRRFERKPEKFAPCVIPLSS